MKKIILFILVSFTININAQNFQGWNRKQAITINSSLVEGTVPLIDFPFLVTLDHLDDEIVDAGANAALNGGGDIRFSSDSAGNNPIAIEVVEFITSPTPANRKCQIWVKIPSLSATADTVIYIWYNKTGEIQPLATDTYGSQTVWSNYEAVWHMENDPSATAPQIMDATGNGYNLSSSGSMSSAAVIDGAVGNAISFDGVDDLFTLSNNLTFGNSFTFSGWYYWSSASTDIYATILQEGAPGYYGFYLYDDLSLGFYGNAGPTSDIYSLAGSISQDSMQRWDFVATNGGGQHYLNSDTIVANNTSNVSSSGTVKYIGGDLEDYMNGWVDEIRVTSTSRSADWVKTEYTNQTNATNMATAGVPGASSDTPPTTPTLSSTSHTDTSVDLSWTASTDDTAVTGYKIYKDGVLEATLGNVLTYQVIGLTEVTSYNFTVTALDTIGNESVVSNTVNITTDSTSISVTNLLDTSTWTEGTGSVVGFSLQGTNSENSRELGTDPHGLQSVLWKAQPTSTSNNVGWKTDYVNIDHTKTYRYTSWIKKTNSDDGIIYLSFSCVDDLGNNTGLNLSGTVNGAPYPFSGDVLHLDEWYLLVGYIHESGYSLTIDVGGLYDTNGVKQSNMDDFKFSNTATRFSLKNYLKFSTNTSDEFFSYGPTLYEISGQEPTIEELINAQPNNNPTYPSGISGIWSMNNQDVYYNTGNVGIGTTTPDEKLTVKGSIHSEEVKVDLSVPAPDYVFETDYTLTPLEKLQNYIKTYKHLPNIPSAKIMEANGIELGTMNMKLLEKIEELTLYTLQQQKELESQKEKHQHLDNRLINLEKLTKSKKK